MASQHPQRRRNSWWDAAPLVTIGAFQVVVWSCDPLGTHTALHKGVAMTLLPRVASAAINGGLWFLLSKALVRHHSTAAQVLTPFAVSFTFNQWLFWWFPYFLGEAAGANGMVAEHKAELKELPRLLPPIGDHLIPSTEHTILQPLSLFALLRTLRMLQRVSTGQRGKTPFRVGSAFFLLLSALSVVAIGQKEGARGSLGCVLVLLQQALVLRFIDSRLEVHPGA